MGAYISITPYLFRLMAYGNSIKRDERVYRSTRFNEDSSCDWLESKKSDTWSRPN